jgi:Nickel responsive protein SCO4226-like
MPRYIIERSVPALGPAELAAAGRRSVAVLAEMPDVKWIRSFVSDAEGKIYCEYDAPSAEAILEHARRAGLPVDHISEVALEISPAMFV